MDNKEIAAKLRRAAQDVESERFRYATNSMTERVMDGVGEAVQILESLDNYLSNAYSGNRGELDEAIDEMREHLSDAMDSLESRNFIKPLRNIE